MKVWVVVIEKHDGTSEIEGVYKDVGDAMVASQNANTSGNKKYKEIYIQEHRVIERVGRSMNLQEFSKFAKRELEGDL